MAAKPPTPELAHHPQPNPPTRQLHLPTLRITPEPRSRPHHPRLETRLGQPQPQQPTNTLQTLPHPKNPTRTNNLHTPKTPPTSHTSRRTPILAQTTYPPGYLKPVHTKNHWRPCQFVVWWWGVIPVGVCAGGGGACFASPCLRRVLWCLVCVFVVMCVVCVVSSLLMFLSLLVCSVDVVK